jgi:hypothetical protein
MDRYFSIEPPSWRTYPPQFEDVIHEFPDGRRVLLESVGWGYGQAATDYKNTIKGAGACEHRRIKAMEFQRLVRTCVNDPDADHAPA